MPINAKWLLLWAKWRQLLNGRKAKKLRRIQTERLMVSLAANVPVTDSSAAIA